MKFSLVIILILTLSIAAAGCGTTTPTPIEESASPTQSPGYPLPSAPTFQSPYPDQGEGGQVFEDVEPEPTPTFDSDKGIIRGKILRNDNPVQDITLYLAEVMKDSEGNELIASFSKTDSPRTSTNQEGSFTFLNITPGRYGLVLDTVIDSYLLHDPENDEQIIISVEQGKEVNIGELSFESLPMP